MFLQIKKLILWPQDPKFEPRTLSFEVGKVNVISGASKTGKSALIPIIDWCLGAEKCAIPVNTIRDHCSWFGIVVVTDEGEKLLARKNPGKQKGTGEMFVLEGDVIQIPREIPSSNTSVNAVKGRLDELAGLSNLDIDPLSGGGQTFRGRPSFRDLMAFCFQPQNVIANQDVLFFKADTYEHREKLKAIFPYVLGALTPEVLAQRWELESLRRDLVRKERELTALNQSSTRWSSELKSWAAKAREYGLVPAGAPDESAETMLEVLRSAVNKSSRAAAITPETINTSIAELVGLEREESVVASELGALRRRHGEMSRLRDTAADYLTALKTQRDRLSVAAWLKTQAGDDSACPICHEPMHQATQELEELYKAVDSVESASKQFKPAPDAFEKEFHGTRESIRTTTDKLTAIRGRKDVLAAKSEDVRKALYRAMDVDRFLGRLEQALATYDGVAPGNDLLAEVAELRERVRALQAAVAERDVRKREESALAKVSAFAARLIPSLDAERPDDAISVSIADLAVKVRSADGRDDYLFEIGSGANWLSYHLAVTLAFQQLFISQPGNPVPGFVVYDQPSQVYFPRRLAARKGEAVGENDDPKLTIDEDVEAVRRAFKVLGDVTAAANGALQVIVLDHADENIWGGIPGVVLNEEWREGRKLVPMTWLAT